MNPDLSDLISSARDVLGEFSLGNDSSAGSVAAALRTSAGNVYTGICLSLNCGIGFCAEHSAVAEMLKHREREVSAIVAVSASRVVPPCGRCRELLLQVSPRNRHAMVGVDGAKSVPLGDLLPHHWLSVNSGQDGNS
jgi:cytidine deaminase